MPLTPGVGGGEYMSREDWLELASEGALVAIVLNGWTTTTVKASGEMIDTAQIDVYILDGKQKGTVHPGENVFGKGIVTPLRRVSVGDEVAYRLVKNKNGATEYAAANAPGDLPQSAIDLFEELKAGGSQAPTEDAKKEPAKAGAGTKSSSNGSKSSNYADEPDF